MREEDKEEFKKIGFDLDTNPIISFIYRIQIVARRISFFNIFYKKYATEDGLTQMVEPEIENVEYKGVEFIKMIFKFKDFSTEDIVKNIIVINDCIRFLSEIFGYTEDGKELIISEFTPGSQIKIANRIDEGYFTVVGYEFDRVRKQIKYKVTGNEQVFIVDSRLIIN
jgi:hypothetical protein